MDIKTSDNLEKDIIACRLLGWVGLLLLVTTLQRDTRRRRKIMKILTNGGKI